MPGQPRADGPRRLGLKVWILEIGEPLPLEADARLHRYGEFSRALAARGHDVTWWTSTFSHAPRRFVASGDQDVVSGGVTLRLIHGPGYARSVSVARILHQRRFAAEFLRRADACPRPDLIIAPVPTIEGAEAAVKWGKAHGVPVVVDIRDLWPDEMLDLAPALLRPAARLILSPLYAKMRSICAGAACLTGVSESYLDYALRFARRARGAADFVFPLGYSAQPVPEERMEAARRWRDRSAIRPDRFTVCFFGTMGNYFSLETVIEAASVLRTEFPIQIVLAGDGANRDRYRALARGLDEVVFPGWLTAPQIAAVMETSKAGLAPYKRGARMSLPNKPFEYFSAGLPVISSIVGELEQLLRANDCGISYAANSASELCAAMRSLYRDEPKRAAMGTNARALFLSRFSTEVIFEGAAGRMELLAAGPSARAVPDLP